MVRSIFKYGLYYIDSALLNPVNQSYINLTQFCYVLSKKLQKNLAYTSFQIFSVHPSDIF